jgi:hypothetical protein
MERKLAIGAALGALTPYRIVPDGFTVEYKVGVMDAGQVRAIVLNDPATALSIQSPACPEQIGALMMVALDIGPFEGPVHPPDLTAHR